MRVELTDISAPEGVLCGTRYRSPGVHSGLSVHALRHYDDVGLLLPAHVDPEPNYRRYRREQIQTARMIQALRWIDLPVATRIFGVGCG